MVRDKVADINQSVQDIQVGTYIVWYVIRLLILRGGGGGFTTEILANTISR